MRPTSGLLASRTTAAAASSLARGRRSTRHTRLHAVAGWKSISQLPPMDVGDCRPQWNDRQPALQPKWKLKTTGRQPRCPRWRLRMPPQEPNLMNPLLLLSSLLPSPTATQIWTSTRWSSTMSQCSHSFRPRQSRIASAKCTALRELCPTARERVSQEVGPWTSSSRMHEENRGISTILPGAETPRG